jgi:hypothetical protein
MAARLSALHAGRFLPWRRFLVLISVKAWVDPRAIVRLEGLGKLKKSTASGTRTGDLPAFSIVPQLFFYLNIWEWSTYWVHSALHPLLAYCTFPGWLWGWRIWWNERFWEAKSKYSEKTCPDATLFTINPTCQTRARTQAAAVGLTASALARPSASTNHTVHIRIRYS